MRDLVFLALLLLMYSVSLSQSAITITDNPEGTLVPVLNIEEITSKGSCIDRDENSILLEWELMSLKS